jgi:3-phosphoshikimate 1-carboxyvinyltransferase
MNSAASSLHVQGDVRVPGDKSITHRALMFAAAARGESRLAGLLAGADCRSTAEALRSLGVAIPELPADGAPITVSSGGLAAWHAPLAPLDCGNSGTTARLMMGLVAGRPFCSTLLGDDSLQQRPMRRVLDPLERMGARVRELGRADRLPVEICGGDLSPIRHRSHHASAQVKSAVLLAGLSGGVRVSIHEPHLSRDHTERLLAGMGVDVHGHAEEGGWTVELDPPDRPLPALDLHVPGDPSSAAFLVALVLLADRGELRIRDVCVNCSRTGFFRVLARMGGFVELHDERSMGGERVADLIVNPATLVGTSVAGDEVPSLIDEIPMLAVLATRAEGETRIVGAEELRAKESDRIRVIVENLRAIGADAEELADGLVVVGSDRPLAGRVRVHGDHRIALSFGVLARVPGHRIEIDHPEVVSISFPGFWSLLDALTGTTRPAPGTAAPPPPAGEREMIIAIDGPAGSGKSSTARAVAAELGFRQLDSGAFYRALTWAALEEGPEPERWPEMTAADLERLDVRGEPEGSGFRFTVQGRRVESELREPRVNALVSRMAAVPAVRDWLLGALRAAGAKGGLVADGRDIGTVVFPGAELKIFLVAAPAERALRRLREQGHRDPVPELVAAEVSRLQARDRQDAERPVAPLLRAADAVLLDTTDLPFEAQVQAIVRLARARASG